jgi:hypothetical protein
VRAFGVNPGRENFSNAVWPGKEELEKRKGEKWEKSDA